MIKKSENQETFDTVYGPFTLNRPNLYRQLEVHKTAAKSLGGVLNLDAMGELYALWMATITIAGMADDQVRKPVAERPRGWPEGFTFETAYDEEFLPDLIKRFNDWLATFRKPQTTDPVEEGRPSGSEEPPVRVADAVGPAAE